MTECDAEFYLNICQIEKKLQLSFGSLQLTTVATCMGFNSQIEQVIFRVTLVTPKAVCWIKEFPGSSSTQRFLTFSNLGPNLLNPKCHEDNSDIKNVPIKLIYILV